ncbi:MAG: hypothetical protein LUF87_01155 [Alistipes sp.]|nr:hypothetical protein [Alistipes sp.]
MKRLIVISIFVLGTALGISCTPSSRYTVTLNIGLGGESNEEIERTVAILKERVSHFGKPGQASIEGNKVVLQFTSTLESTNVYRLLQTPGRLTMHDMYPRFEMEGFNTALIEYYTREQDTVKPFDRISELILPPVEEYGGSYIMGYVTEEDKKELEALFGLPEWYQYIPRNACPALLPIFNGSESIYEFVLIKGHPDHLPSWNGNIEKVRSRKNKYELPELVIIFDKKGTEDFERFTADNVGCQVALVVDGNVFSSPLVTDPIKNGRCNIGGNFTEAEARMTMALTGSPELTVPVSVESLRRD